MLGAPFLIVSSSPVAQGIPGASQQSPSWHTSFAMRRSPQGSTDPGLLGGCRLSGGVVAIGGLPHDPRHPWSLRGGRKWISQEQTTDSTPLSHFTAVPCQLGPWEILLSTQNCSREQEHSLPSFSSCGLATRLGSHRPQCLVPLRTFPGLPSNPTSLGMHRGLLSVSLLGD